MPICGRRSPTQLTTTLDVERAFRNPLEGWPKYAVMSPAGDPLLRAEMPILGIQLGRFPPHHIVAQAANGPATVALGARGAEKGPLEISECLIAQANRKSRAWAPCRKFGSFLGAPPKMVNVSGARGFVLSATPVVKVQT